MVRSSHSPERYEQMLANSATAAICAGADNLIVSWNSAAERLFGHSAQVAIGQPLSIIIPLDIAITQNSGCQRWHSTSATPIKRKQGLSFGPRKRPRYLWSLSRGLGI